MNDKDEDVVLEHLLEKEELEYDPPANLPMTLSKYLRTFAAYPVFYPDDFAEHHATYRQAVEELYDLRQNGHREADHCEQCAEPRALHDRLKDDSEADIKEVQKAWETFVELQRKGHLRQPHCPKCHQCKQRIYAEIKALTYGSRNLLVRKVMSSAYYTADRGLTFRDLFQEALSRMGNSAIALYNAKLGEGLALPVVLRIEEFGDEYWTIPEPPDKPKAKANFVTYLDFWVRSALQRVKSDLVTSNSARLPVHIQERLQGIHQLEKVFSNKHGHYPEPKELVEFIKTLDKAPQYQRKLTEESIRKSRKSSHFGAPVSLQKKIRSDEKDAPEFGEMQTDEGTLSPEKIVALKQMTGLVGRVIDETYSVLKQLNSNEALVLKYRLGLAESETFTLEEVGKKLSLTRERIRQIEKSALGKLHGRTGLHGKELQLLSLLHDELMHLVHDVSRKAPDGTARTRADTEGLPPDIARCYQTMDLGALSNRLTEVLKRLGKEGWITQVSPTVCASDRRRTKDLIHALELLEAPEREIIPLLQRAAEIEDGHVVVKEPIQLLEKHAVKPKEAITALRGLIERGSLRLVESGNRGHMACVEVLAEDSHAIALANQIAKQKRQLYTLKREETDLKAQLTRLRQLQAEAANLEERLQRLLLP